jgi:hypothetical protein
MLKTKITVGLAALMLGIASTSAPAQPYRVFGEGLNSCGAWTQARQVRSAGLSAHWVAARAKDERGRGRRSSVTP